MAPRRLPSLGHLLVTGANGFVGGHLLPRLRAAFPDARLTLCGQAEGMRQTDFADAAAVEALVAETKPDAVLHLAAIAAIPAARRDPTLAWRINLGGTLALARGILAAAPTATLVYVSSADIYGGSFHAGVALDESALPAPANTYAATKAATDLALGAMVPEGLRVVRLRPFNHTGPGQSPDFVVPAFARQVAAIAAGRQEPVLHVGALAPERDFLDVRDVCDAYVAALARREELPAGCILNIASGTPRRIGDVLAELMRLGGISDARVETSAPLLRPGDLARACGNATRAHTLLGWTPRIAWDQTLRDVLADWTARAG